MSSAPQKCHHPASTVQAQSVLDRLRQAYGDKEQEDRADSYVSRFLYRPLSFYLSVPFVWLGFSGNQVTILRAILALLSAVLVAFPKRGFVVLGASLYAFCVLLDYVDGNLARLDNASNNFGALLEELADQVGPSLFPVAVGVGLYFRSDQLLRLLGSAGPASALVAGAITSIAYCLGTIALFYVRFSPVLSRGPSDRSPSRGIVVRRTRSLGSLMMNESIYLSVVFGVVLAAVFNVLSAYLFARGIRNLIFLVISLRLLSERMPGFPTNLRQ